MNVSEKQSTFDERLTQAVQQSFLDLVRKGDWIKIDYNARVNVQQSLLSSIYSMVDMEAVKKKVAESLVDTIAGGIVAGLVTETGNDVKRIMCNPELREELRGIVRDKIRKLS